jgi:RimJ/RimL family protein N-acetyltransferase
VIAYARRVFEPVYPVTTDRLLLRPIDPSTDIDAMHAYQSRDDVCRYIPYEPRTREQVAERVAAARSTLAGEGQALWLVVELRSTGEVIGDVMLFWHSAKHRGGEIGYVINPDHQGNGYAREAAQALLALAFDGLGLHRVVGRIDARNETSARVLRRLGMRQEAHLVRNEWFKDDWSDEIDFAMLEDEWHALRES